METIDIVIVALGVVVLVAAVTGAIIYEPDTAGLTFNVDWSGDTTTLEAQTASLGASGGSETFEFDVTVLNVTTATFSTTLQVSSGHLNQDELIVNVTAPNGSATEESTTLSAGAEQTTLELDRDVGTIPTVSTVEAANATDAIAILSEEHASEEGTGTWVVEVTVDHGGTSVTGSHDVEVTPTIGFYSAQVTKASPDVRAN